MSSHEKKQRDDNGNRHEGLRQELLEYYFECHPDSESIERRIAEDAEVAALYEEVKQTAALLEDAAITEAPPLRLTPPDQSELARETVRRPRRPWTFRHTWYAAAAMVAIALIPAIGIWLHRTWKVDEVVNSKVRLIVSAPPAIPDGSPLRFHVETCNLAQKKMVAQVDWKVLDEDGRTLSESTTMCNGTTDITVAGRLAKPRKLVVTATVPGSGFQKTVEQKIHPTNAAPLVHITSDKPAYRPGEPVRLRIACLDRLTLQAAEHVGLRCRVVDPKGASVQQQVLGVGSGVAVLNWQVAPNAMGGQYALEVRDNGDQFTLERHPFLVRNFQPPKLKKKIVLDRQTYVAGATGAADLLVTRAGGGPAAGAKVHATLIVDGDEGWKEEAVLDGEGRAVFRFQVPTNVQKGAARFVARITDGGNVETELEPFVVPTDKVEVALYPEGGDLVSGTENRVYAQVQDALGRPLSGEGDIVDDQGTVVAAFQTLHMGRTRFSFTPQKGRSYQLKLVSPQQKTFDLPKVIDDGVVLQPVGDFVAAGEPVKVDVFASGQGPWMASVFCRGVLVGQHSVLQRGKSQVVVPVVEEASGVLRVTVFDRKMRPVAERLIQRASKRNLVVTVTPESVRRTPGQKQKITVRTTDETGEPVSCVVGLTVTDRSVADMLDETRTGLHDQQQLWTDVEKPDDKVEEFLVGHAEYRRNIDLLLGTMGWRRYVWRGESDSQALAAAGGEWAKALPVREGLSFAPLTTDTKASYQAELSLVNWSQDEAWRLLAAFAFWSLIAVVVLGAVHVLVAFSRRMEWRPPVVIGSTATALAFLASVLVLSLQRPIMQTLGAPAEDAVAVSRPMVQEAAGDPAMFFDDFDDRTVRMPTDLAGVVTYAAAPHPNPPRLSLGQLSLGTFGYVRDFDVQVARGATILLDGPESTIKVRLDEIANDGFGLIANRFLPLPVWEQTKGWATTGSEVFYLAPTAPGSGPQGRVGFVGYVGPGGTYRGPGDVIPPDQMRVLLDQAVDHVLDAVVEVENARRELKDLPLTSANHQQTVARLTQTIQQKGPLVDWIHKTYPGLLPPPSPIGGLQISPAKRRQIETVLRHPQLAQAAFAYTHQHGDSRGSFAETLFWQPFLVTDEKGEANVEFDVSDSITTWKIYADAHGHGRVGQATGEFESYLPFFMEPKVPSRISEGDMLRIPVSIVADDKSQKQAKVEFQTTGPLVIQSGAAQTVALKDGRGRAILEIVAGKPAGNGAHGSITIRGEVQGARDILVRSFVVVPRGFPHRVDHAGKVKGAERLKLTVPDELAKRTAQWTLRFYPSPLANLEEALRGMLQEPGGCFEQVSSSNYPNVMVLSLLESSGDNIPAAAAQAQRLLASGYKQLTAYEVAGGGFEWWGKDPAHACLTVYGLMQFADMARVYDGVDPAMVARTRAWLLGKRDGDGGFATGGGRYGHFMGGSQESRSAYITYALLYAGSAPTELRRELDHLEARAKSTDNGYELGVIACALAKGKRPTAARDVCTRLLELQQKDGSLLGTGSITGSGKGDLAIETTAFAVLAWLADSAGQDDRYDAAVLRAVNFLEKNRNGGGNFGGTQATVMALKALTAYLGANSKALQPGSLKVFLGDALIADRVLTGREKRTITIEGLAAHLSIGANDVRIELSDGNEFPFSSELTYRADEPASSPDCVLDLNTWLTKAIVAEGSTTALHAVVSNKTDKPVANPMVIVGLPAGLHVDAKILDDLKKSETIAAWELTDDSIVLYLRGLDAGEKRDIVIDVVGRIPGQTKGPASRAYLYYTGRLKRWVAPLAVEVTEGR